MQMLHTSGHVESQSINKNNFKKTLEGGTLCREVAGVLKYVAAQQGEKIKD